MSNQKLKIIQGYDNNSATEINNLFRINSLFGVELPSIFYSEHEYLTYLSEFYKKLKGSEKHAFLSIEQTLDSINEEELDVIIELISDLVLKFPNLIISNNDQHFLRFLKNNVADISTCSDIVNLFNIKENRNQDYGLAKPTNSTSYILELIEAIQKQKIMLDWNGPAGDYIWPFVLTSISDEDEDNIFIFTKNEQVKRKVKHNISTYRKTRHEFHSSRQ